MLKSWDGYERSILEVIKDRKKSELEKMEMRKRQKIVKRMMDRISIKSRKRLHR